jgi:hypothetical protein
VAKATYADKLEYERRGASTRCSKTRELKKFFDVSYAYVASLKPKPTTKKKKTTKA